LRRVLPWLGYSRVSRVGDRAERLISPDLQRQRIEAYAVAHGLAVELLEPELDVSGAKAQRPILGAAIERVERGEAAGIIVAQLDRLSRMDVVDALATIRRIESAGGQVIAVAENFDAATPEGRLGRNVFLALGEMQLDRYRAQFRAAKSQAVRRGIWPTRTAPIGYRVAADRTLVPDTRRRSVVRAFVARAAGAPWRSVGQILGRGPSGARKVITNRVYLGELRLGEWVNPSAHEPLVGRDLWEAAQIPHPRPPRAHHPPALLRGVVRCAGCRRTMSPDSAPTQRNYRCKKHFARGQCPAPAAIGFSVIDPYVEDLVLSHLEGISVIEYEGPDTAELEQVLDRAEAELAAYQEAIDVAEVGPEHFARGLEQRVAEVGMARADLARARVGVAPSAIGDLLGRWHELSVQERSHVLRGALGVVWVRRGRLPVAERVRVIAAGSEPNDLPRAGVTAPLVGIEWDDDLPGEITGSQDVGKGAGGADA
jgi:DNA invertase Pin-like site-specific DNA recombinase